MTSGERRQQIAEILSDRRFETIENLAAEFGVSVRTIKYDIAAMTSSVPIYTVQGNGGGVRAMDGWYLSRRYLHDDWEEMLRRILPGLQPEDQKMMQQLLKACAKPKKEEDHCMPC